MSDKFEQCQCNAGEWQGELCGTCNGTGEAALSSLQGEAVGEAFNGRCFIYDAHPVKNLHIENGAKLFTYPPDASAKIAELESKLAKVEKDAERYRYLRDCGDGFDLSVREEDEEGENWVTGYPPEDLDAAIDAYLDAAIQESKKGGAV